MIHVSPSILSQLDVMKDLLSVGGRRSVGTLLLSLRMLQDAEQLCQEADQRGKQRGQLGHQTSFLVAPARNTIARMNDTPWTTPRMLVTRVL